MGRWINTSKYQRCTKQKFLNIQIGTGFNTQTIGKDFYGYKGSSTDFLGYDNGERSLPASFPVKTVFASETFNEAQKATLGATLKNNWVANKTNNTLNESVLINGGFNKKYLAIIKLQLCLDLITTKAIKEYNHKIE